MALHGKSIGQTCRQFRIGLCEGLDSAGDILQFIPHTASFGIRQKARNFTNRTYMPGSQENGEADAHKPDRGKNQKDTDFCPVYRVFQSGFPKHSDITHIPVKRFGCKNPVHLPVLCYLICSCSQTFEHCICSDRKITASCQQTVFKEDQCVDIRVDCILEHGSVRLLLHQEENRATAALWTCSERKDKRHHFLSGCIHETRGNML